MEIIQEKLNQTIHKIESQGQYWKNYMYYYGTMVRWAKHFELKLELIWSLKTIHKNNRICSRRKITPYDKFGSPTTGSN